MMLPFLFRSVNGFLVTTESNLIRKVLKISLWMSSKARRLFSRSESGKSNWVIISNFDRTIRLKIDVSRSMGEALYWSGFHEFREFIFLHRFLKAEMVVVDIGANLGEYTLFMAKRVSLGRVFAFEPLPSILNLLHENVSLNGFENIETVAKGLSDREGMMNIHEVDDVHEGLNTFYLGDRKSKISIPVELTTLDRFVEQKNLGRLDFIKIDIEGGELFALRGAVSSIRKFRPLVLVEINELTYQSAGYSSSDVAEFFSLLNYRASIVNKSGELTTIDNLPVFGNVFFIPN